MAYRQQLYISPTTLTDLTVTIEYDNPELPSETLTLNDFSIVDDELNAGFAVLSDCTVTIQSQGYETKTLNITIEDLEDKHIVLTPLLDYFSKVSDGTDTYFVKAEVIKNQQNNSSLKYWTGTKAQYDAIVTKDANTLYNVTDDDTADAYEAYTKSEVDNMFVTVDLDNLSNAGKQKIIDCVMPSTSQIDFTITTSGQTILMPNSGYLQVIAYGSKSTNSFIGLYGNVSSMVVPFADNTDMRGFIPVSEGENVQVYFNNATNIQVYLRKSKGVI